MHVRKLRHIFLIYAYHCAICFFFFFWGGGGRSFCLKSFIQRIWISGQAYTARIAPNHLNVFLNLGTLIAKDDSRLLEADAVSMPAVALLDTY